MSELRDDEREPVLTIPPIVGVVVVRVEPLPIVVTVRIEEVQIAIGMYKMPSMPPPFEYSQG